MTLEEISQSLKASLYDRTHSPLFGTFIISWCLWNYRFLFVLFSSLNVQEKFNYIDYRLYPDPWLTIFQCLIGPIVTSILFLLFYHYPAKWIFRIWRTHHKDMKEIRRQIDDKTPLTIEESNKLKKHFEKTMGIFQTEIITKDHRISALQERLEEIQNVNDTLQKQLNEWKGQPKDPQTQRVLSDQEIEAILLSYRFRLYFNPKDSRRSKMMTFMRLGSLAEGRNNNEDSWRVKDGKLEFIQVDGRIHSRFNYIPESNIFTHTNDEDTLSIRGQYMFPE